MLNAYRLHERARGLRGGLVLPKPPPPLLYMLPCIEPRDWDFSQIRPGGIYITNAIYRPALQRIL